MYHEARLPLNVTIQEVALTVHGIATLHAVPVGSSDEGYPPGSVITSFFQELETPLVMDPRSHRGVNDHPLSQPEGSVSVAFDPMQVTPPVLLVAFNEDRHNAIDRDEPVSPDKGSKLICFVAEEERKCT
jgi:hypothetical protein